METRGITKVYVFIALFSLILLVLQIPIVQATRANTLEEQVTQQQTRDYVGYFVVFIIIVIIIGAPQRQHTQCISRFISFTRGITMSSSNRSRKANCLIQHRSHFVIYCC